MNSLSLDDLFNELDRCDVAVPLDMLCQRLRRLDVSGDELRRHVAFGDAGYRRNLLRLGPGYAALLLCWRPGQASPIHDHRGSACGVRVIEGVATETRYRREVEGRLVKLAANSYPTETVCGSYDADIHSVSNRQPEGHNLVTLHVYTPPMRHYHAYSMDSPRICLCADEEVLAEERRRGHAATAGRGGATLCPGPGG